MKITVTMDEEIARILMDATEFYARVLCGQYEEIPREVTEARSEHIIKKEGKEAWEQVSSEEYGKHAVAEGLLMMARRSQFPELDGISHHWGLGYSRMTDISYNLYQAVRYAWAWHDQTEGGITVDFNPPSASEMPYPMVEIDGKQYLNGNCHF